MTEPTRMTKGERDMLLSLMKKREGVLKSTATQRALEMMAEFERQISAIYPFAKEEVWKAALEAGEKAVAEANEKVAARCIELGIPEEFRPSLQVYWASRGENQWNERRTELRRAAKTEIAAIEQKAKAEIERISLEAQTKIMSYGLNSDEAKAFFETLPGIEKLMPTIEVKSIEGKVRESQRRPYMN